MFNMSLIMFMCWILGYQAQEFDIELCSCTVHQLRYERMSRQLDLDYTWSGYEQGRGNTWSDSLLLKLWFFIAFLGFFMYIHCRLYILTNTFFFSRHYDVKTCIFVTQSIRIGGVIFLAIQHHKKLLYLFYILTLQNIQHKWFYFFTYSFKYYFFLIISFTHVSPSLI